jgi:chromosome segregation ATPase
VNRIGLKALVALGLVAAPGWAAAEPPPVSVQQHLEVSLGALRQRERDISARNQWLRAEMDSLREAAGQMRRELAELAESRRSLEDGEKVHDDMVRNLNLMEKQVLRANMTAGQLQSERRRLQARLDEQEERRRRVQARIDRNAAEISELKNLKTPPATERPVDPLAEEISRYRALVERGVVSLDRAERQHEAARDKYERPLQKIERLKAQKEEALQQVNLLEDELKVFLEEEAILKRQMEEARQERQREISGFQEKLTVLRDKQSRLDQVLGRARLKIENRNIVFDINQDSAGRLEENLSVLSEQNLALKDQLNSLRSTLESLGKKDF